MTNNFFHLNSLMRRSQRLSALSPSFVYLLIFCVALVLFTVLSLARLSRPVPGDDLWLLEAARTFYMKGIPLEFHSKFSDFPSIYFHHPYLYIHVIMWMFDLLGMHAEAARMVGILSGISAIVMVYFITYAFSQGNIEIRRRYATITSSLYALSPCTIQGYQFIQVDSTILVPSVLFMVTSFVYYSTSRKTFWFILTSASVCISLWERISTPVLIICLFGLIAIAKKRWYTIVPLVAGMMLFVGTWYIYSWLSGLDVFWGPFKYTLSTMASKSGNFSLFSLAQNLIQLVLWTGVLHVFILSFVFIFRLRFEYKTRKLNPEDTFLLCGVFLFTTYIFVGGLTFGFPRYHAPAIAMLYTAVAVILSKYPNWIQRIPWCYCILSGIAICLIQIFVVDDLLYQLRYVLRSSLAFEQSVYPTVRIILIGCSWFLLACIVMIRVGMRRYGRKIFIYLLLFLSAGTHAGTTIIQSTAGYDTGFMYGSAGTHKVVANFHKKLRTSEGAVVPQTIAYYLNSSYSPYQSNKLWSNPEAILKTLSNNRNVAFVYSVSTNTIQQIRTIHNNMAVRLYLEDSFARCDIGSFVIWNRRYPSVNNHP